MTARATEYGKSQPRGAPMGSTVMHSDIDLSHYVQPGRVHRRLYTDPRIFDLEMERIFGHAWIYVGHESQIRNAGDYLCTQIGRKPVILVRDAAGEVRVIHN